MLTHPLRKNEVGIIEPLWLREASLFLSMLSLSQTDPRDIWQV